MASLTYDKFVNVMQGGNADQVMEVINDVKQLQYKGEFLPLIQDMYGRKKNKYPKMNWHVIELPVIRVELADVLLQANKNRLVKINVKQIQSELRSQITSSDTEVVQRALLALSIIDDESDIELISRFAAQENSGSFRQAVVALSQMCSPKAVTALKSTLVLMKESTSQDFIKQNVENSKRLHDMGWCSH